MIAERVPVVFVRPEGAAARAVYGGIGEDGLSICPYCGARAVVVAHGEVSEDEFFEAETAPRGFSVGCGDFSGCGCTFGLDYAPREGGGLVDVGAFPTREKAVAAWNRRAMELCEGERPSR